MEESLETRRNNMIRNLYDFLLDDCYIYLMTVGHTAFLANKEKGNSFYTMSMCLSYEFVTRITKIYADMNKTNIVYEEYHKILQKTIETITSESHNVLVSFNKKADNNYDIVFVNKN
jgi:hypothetical protein